MLETKSQPNKFHRSKIGDFGRVVTGKTPPTKNQEYYGDKYPFITPTDISDSSIFVDTPERHLSEEGAIKIASSKLPVNSVCYTCIASVGKIAITKEESFTNQQINSVIVDPQKADYRYVFYLLKNITPEIKGMVGGAASPIINKSAFENIDVDILNPQTQKGVADILFTYDQLIENNTKRIKILEEIAQAIYREWFVKPINNGELPNGWEVSTLGEHLTGLESGSRPKGGVGEVKEGVPSVGAENINSIGRHAHNSEKYIAKEFFEKMKRGVVQDRDVALYKDGAYIGKSSYFRDGFPHKIFSVNEHVFLLRSSGDRITQNFLYLWLREPDTIHEIRATNANAAQPGINQPGVRGLKIILPPQKMVENFDAKVEPILASIINLAKQNNELRQARDLLLPKLVTGEVGVR